MKTIIAGALKDFTMDGMPWAVAKDCKVTILVGNKIEVQKTQTTDAQVLTKEKMSEMIKGIKLSLKMEEFKKLSDMKESGKNFVVSLLTADNGFVSCNGVIFGDQLEWSSEDGSVEFDISSSKINMNQV